MRKLRRAQLLLVATALVGGLLTGCRRPPPGEPPVETQPATVSGPVTGGKTGVPYFGIKKDLLDRNGYVEEEFFFEGTANSYEPEGELGGDGKWTLKPYDSAPYKTRMVVRRPKDPARFSGNAVVEWYNVSAGHDADPDFIWNYPAVFRSGDIHVSVSAQRAGVETGGGVFAIPGDTGGPLKGVDPERYGSLSIKDDTFSYDIFTQAGAALKSPEGVDPLGGMRPERIIGTGQSQSAARMTSYVNGVHPLAKVYDGFLIHSRGGGVTGFGGGGGFGATPTQVRDDIDVPVIQIQTESEIMAGFATARQPDSEHVRTWEVAGAAHVDKKALDEVDLFADTSILETRDVLIEACGYVNDGQQNYVIRRAISDLFTWAETGQAPASAPPINMDKRDEHGNVTGGVRTPIMEAPFAVLSPVGSFSAGSGLTAVICVAFGSTKPFDDAKLQSLYPTHQDYVDKVTAATDAAISAGFILPADRQAIISEAEAAEVP